MAARRMAARRKMPPARRNLEPRLAAPDITDDALVLVLALAEGDADEEAAMRELLSASGAKKIREIPEETPA